VNAGPAGSGPDGPVTGAARGGPLEVIARISRGRRPVQGERCEMCGEPIAQEHQHVVNVEQRSLLCTCRPCYLLFTAEDAALRYRAVPDRFLSFPGLRLGPGQWDDLEIPVGLAFVFRNSSMGRWVAFYPGPAGATESMLPLTAWDAVLTANAELRTVRPDVEALLLRVTRGGGHQCFLVPIDSCYELIGRLRQVWRGFDGGTEATGRIDEYFRALTTRAREAVAAE